jgi:hypothetical protein
MIMTTVQALDSKMAQKQRRIDELRERRAYHAARGETFDTVRMTVELVGEQAALNRLGEERRAMMPADDSTLRSGNVFWGSNS